jgi:hypothetical protein
MKNWLINYGRKREWDEIFTRMNGVLTNPLCKNPELLKDTQRWEEYLSELLDVDYLGCFTWDKETECPSEVADLDKNTFTKLNNPISIYSVGGIVGKMVVETKDGKRIGFKHNDIRRWGEMAVMTFVYCASLQKSE